MAVKRGEGCIEGMRCPECGNHERFIIEAATSTMFEKDGSSDYGGDMTWDNDSYCRCPECDKEGEVADFSKKSKQAQKSFTVIGRLNGADCNEVGFVMAKSAEKATDAWVRFVAQKNNIQVRTLKRRGYVVYATIQGFVSVIEHKEGL